MYHKSLIGLLICTSLSSIALAQPIERSQVKAVSNRQVKESFSISTIDTDKLYKVERRNLKHFVTPTVRLKSNKGRQITLESKINTSEFPTSFEPVVKIGIERKQAIAYVFIPQYIKTPTGNIEELISNEFELIEGNAPANKTSGNRVYASNSVLASGNWYKIAVGNQGIFKITGDFIQSSLGINLSTINPANIRLYGNGGTMLSENNSVERADDLVENAIKVVDGGDGQFNNNDYILFYANGPHTIVKDSANKGFKHLFNLYSEQCAYFLNFDLGPGKRIQNVSTPSNGNVNVNSFNEFQFYEKDSTNLGKFGKTWWGTQFNDGLGAFLNRSISFDIPNLQVSEPVKIATHTGTAGSYSGFSNLNIQVNGQTTQSIQYSPFSGSDPYWLIPAIIDNQSNSLVTNPTSPLVLNLSYSKGSSGAVGYIDYIEINARRNLVFNGYLNFADWNSVGASNIATYSIENANSNTEVWDITNPLIPQRMNTTINGSTLSFTQLANELHRFVALDGSILGSPTFIEKTPNQNLHNYTALDYIIIVHPSFLAEANRLAMHHTQKRGYKTKVVTLQEIYNEFSSGTQDISAIRDYIKMVYDKASINEIPKNVLFFGDASYDYKNRLANNTNFVPVYETNESKIRIDGFGTDDFFGYLDDNEDINITNIVNTLDVGIGRLPVYKTSQANDVVNKIIHYDSPSTFGPWKNNFTFNADDGDSGSHLKDAEALVDIINDSLPIFNNYKIYVDGFVQESTPAGSRSPDANKAIVSQLYNGTFVMNYSGHGGPTSWCDERIFNVNDINSMTNKDKLPLFITATCDFAQFDNPAFESAGEILINKANAGAIALMTTTQLVFAYSNAVMNGDYMRYGFSKMNNGQYPTLGDAYRLSKNRTYIKNVSQYDPSNFRKFVLLGDPGLPLAFPKHQVFTDSVNGNAVSIASDTLKAQGKYTIKGHVSDENGNLLNGFNGTVYPTIFDKPKTLTTLQNGTDNPKKEYSLQNNAIYKGKASVKNGEFSFTFVVPKDIDYQIGHGKISYYADNSIEDANGYDNTIFVGGSANNANTDNAGPLIKPFMNNEKFVNGGITNANSILLLKLSDDNGINYTGTSVGHDITAVLDGNTQNTYILNNFFEADLDDYQRGVVKFPVNNLTEGNHTFTIKAWDVFNNSAEVKLDFVVVSSTDAKLSHVYNFPNPFTTKTQFMFEHNMPNQNLHVSIDVFSMSGKVVKSIRTNINTPGTRVDGIEWDGRDAFGDKLGRGVYFYKLHVKSEDGMSESKLQKLILL